MRLSAPIPRLKRTARERAKKTGVPLHQALDDIARSEGFRSWSHLAAAASAAAPRAQALLGALTEGDLVLLGGRPGHGKTLAGLELAARAPETGRTGLFFTLDYSDAEVAHRLADLTEGSAAPRRAPLIDTSDDICADRIAARLQSLRQPALAVVDYLQLLDQRRTHPPLEVQVRALKSAARANRSVIVLISQIDRSFEMSRRPMPELSDVRLPNPLDLSIFDRACFLHDGAVRMLTPG